jgi:hypothetical protein
VDTFRRTVLLCVCVRISNTGSSAQVSYYRTIVSTADVCHAVCQAYKLSDALALSLRSLDPATKADLPTSSVSQLFSYVSGHLPRQGSLASTYLVKWSLLDIVTLSVIGSLHIPGLLQSRGRIARYLPIFLLVNAILFGQIDVSSHGKRLVRYRTKLTRPSELSWELSC